jgi:hypothetical protein
LKQFPAICRAPKRGVVITHQNDLISSICDIVPTQMVVRLSENVGTDSMTAQLAVAGIAAPEFAANPLSMVGGS